MKFIRIDDLDVAVCDSCMDDDHLCDGLDHRESDENHKGCHNTETINNMKYQCACNSHWKQLIAGILLKRKGSRTFQCM